MKLVSGGSYGHDVAWNPWATLKARPDIELVWEPLAARAGGGAYYRAPDGVTVILLDKRMHRRDRNAVLAHELVHDEFAGGKESAVDKEVARRLVPPLELRDFCERQAEVCGGVEAWEVAEHFDVPESVACRAMAALRWGPAGPNDSPNTSA